MLPPLAVIACYHAHMHVIGQVQPHRQQSHVPNVLPCLIISRKDELFGDANFEDLDAEFDVPTDNVDGWGINDDAVFSGAGFDAAEVPPRSPRKVSLVIHERQGSPLLRGSTRLSYRKPGALSNQSKFCLKHELKDTTTFSFETR